MTAGAPKRRSVRVPWRPAVVAMSAVLLTLATVLLIDPELGPAVLGIAMTASLARSQLERDRRGRLEAGVALPIIGIAASGIGSALVHAPWLGAGLYVVGLTVSVLLRIPGGVWRRIGGLLAIPFVALLIAPGGHSDRFGPLGALLIPIAVGVVAWVWVTISQVCARRLGLLGPPPASAAQSAMASPAGGARASRLRPRATIRLAMQMAVSVSAAFIVGLLAFPDRWSWIVITTVIVVVGNRGRADVLQKAAHRVVGAAAGTVLVFLLALNADAAPGLAIAGALAAVFAGLLLRDLGYAWWAAAVTVALAIVQQLGGAPPFRLVERWEEIVLGALIAVLPALVLLPIRSSGVVRLRIGAVLAAISQHLTQPSAENLAAVGAACRELQAVAGPYDDLRRLTRGRVAGPAQWIPLTLESARLASREPRSGDDGPAARRAIGSARLALRDPETLTDALIAARDALSD
ncbi:FUSC family protein [Rathayibacter sp. YIM 133350]|uniref:FUSC family protein n=1 Tax=Rathayibacter sp. YIM 133350 TaxID=3131992 RepID=UPI00307E7DC2